jgi:hypothetical protein
VWDVVVGNPRAVLQEGNKPILGKGYETGTGNSYEKFLMTSNSVTLFSWL